jgi:hypothetical protein
MASSDLEMVRLTVTQQVSFTACRSKLAEVAEKTMKAALIRLGWPKSHPSCTTKGRMLTTQN